MAARKPKSRKTSASSAKIRVHTDEYGRKVYTVVGTKKYAYTLAKAKELVAKKAPKKRAAASTSTALTTTRKRKATTKRKSTVRRTTGAKRNAKGQFVKAGRRTTRRNAARQLTGALADRRDRVSAADTRHVEQHAMYEVDARLRVQGRKIPKKSLGEVEGKHDGVAVANEFLERFGIKNLVYREDRGYNVLFLGKAGSGVTGVLEVAAINPEDAMKGRGSDPGWRRVAQITRLNRKRVKSKRSLSGITLAQTKTVARNILREISGEDPMSEYGRKAVARDAKRAGVITGLTAESAYMEGGVDETMLPAALRGKGYFDFDNAHRMYWTKN
jgi:hypothetical protein